MNTWGPNIFTWVFESRSKEQGKQNGYFGFSTKARLFYDENAREGIISQEEYEVLQQRHLVQEKNLRQREKNA